jgi:protocatechuate 3,4-dioxygenase alpha subunit
MNATPGLTVGPLFGFALPYPDGHALVLPHRPDAIRLHGTILDGAGDPVPDALLEIWQADGTGRVPREPGSLLRDGYTFTGWGRAPTENVGEYSFTTIEPGRSEAGRAPFIALTIFARGLMDRLFTRVYLPDSAELDVDPFLLSVPPARRSTLVAVRDGERSLRFDVHLQGEQETVFLAFAGHWAGGIMHC